MTVDGDIGTTAQIHLPPIWRFVLVVGMFALFPLLKPLSKLIDRWLDSRTAAIQRERWGMVRAYVTSLFRLRKWRGPTEDLR
jgi:hypothetical protein